MIQSPDVIGNCGGNISYTRRIVRQEPINHLDMQYLQLPGIHSDFLSISGMDSIGKRHLQPVYMNSNSDLFSKTRQLSCSFDSRQHGMILVIVPV